ncbi:MAG: hypothetical protein MZV64_71365 [Ignavibacteriales bacterium]|nr:hypothetical protein [Ignavibacteriales bacterium]
MRPNSAKRSPGPSGASVPCPRTRTVYPGRRIPVLPASSASGGFALRGRRMSPSRPASGR